MKRVREVSLFASNFGNIGEVLKELLKTEIRTIHFDVMDGKFVPNTALNEGHYKKIDLNVFKVNVHLMVSDPEFYVKKYIALKPEAITFHCEAKDKQINLKLLSEIKKFGIKAGIAISPQTSLPERLEEIKASDFITFMSVTPGFNGQPFMKDSPSRLAQLRRLDTRPELEVEIDGGMRIETVPLVRNYVNYYVFGSAYFKERDWSAVDRKFKEILSD